MAESKMIERIRTELRAKDVAYLAGVIPPVRSIATVGGRFENGAFKGTDEDYFWQTICYLADSEITIDPDFTITNYNLDPEYGGRDFLDRPDQADLLFFMVVFNPEGRSAIRHFSNYPKYSDACVSRLHSEQAFRESARATKARFIACQAISRTEIGEWVFSPDAEDVAESDLQYETVIITRDRFILRETFRRMSTPCSFSCEKTTLGSLARAFAARSDPGEDSTILYRRIRNLGLSELSCP